MTREWEKGGGGAGGSGVCFSDYALIAGDADCVKC